MRTTQPLQGPYTEPLTRATPNQATQQHGNILDTPDSVSKDIQLITLTSINQFLCSCRVYLWRALQHIARGIVKLLQLYATHNSDHEMQNFSNNRTGSLNVEQKRFITDI